jgi:hypothetical protein
VNENGFAAPSVVGFGSSRSLGFDIVGLLLPKPSCRGLRRPLPFERAGFGSGVGDASGERGFKIVGGIVSI